MKTREELLARAQELKAQTLSALRARKTDPVALTRTEAIYFEFSDTLRATAGRAWLRSCRVEFSGPIFDREENQALQFDQCVLHEIAHITAGVPGHSEYWRMVARVIGCLGEQYHHMETYTRVPVPEVEPIPVARRLETLRRMLP